MTTFLPRAATKRRPASCSSKEPVASTATTRSRSARMISGSGIGLAMPAGLADPVIGGSASSARAKAVATL